MTPEAGDDVARKQLLVEAWKQTVAVQQHFNDIELRIRSFAISFLGVVLGAAAVAHQQAGSSHLAALIAFIGLIGWGGFYMMDGLWYHRLLYGSVKHGEVIEKALEAAGEPKAFQLTQTISHHSPYKLFGRWDLHTNAKLKLFYLGGAAIFVLMISAFFLLPTPASKTTEPSSVHIAVGQEAESPCATQTPPRARKDSTRGARARQKTPGGQ